MHERKYQLAAECVECFRATNPAAFTSFTDAVGGAEHARAQLIELYVAEYDQGVAKERSRCIAIVELARGAGKPGMALAQEFVDSGMSVEDAFQRLLVVSENSAATSLAYQVITMRAREYA